MKKWAGIFFFWSVLVFTSRWTGITFGYKGKPNTAMPTEYWWIFLIIAVVLLIIDKVKDRD